MCSSKLGCCRQNPSNAVKKEIEKIVEKECSGGGHGALGLKGLEGSKVSVAGHAGLKEGDVSWHGAPGLRGKEALGLPVARHGELDEYINSQREREHCIYIHIYLTPVMGLFALLFGVLNFTPHSKNASLEYP